MKEKGFTLAEILVVMAITAIVGIIMVIIFSNTLRGSNKAQILAVIKQNGQAVLDNMDKTIRGADNVVCISSYYLVVVKDGIYTRYRIKSENNIPTIVQDSPVMGSLINDICTLSDSTGVAKIILTDTNSQSGVSVLNGSSFSRSAQSGSKDSVTVSILLGPGAGVPAAISSQIDPVSFQTTIELR